MSVVMVDPFERNDVEIVNESGLETPEVMRAIREDHRLVAEFTQWFNEANGSSSGGGYGHGHLGVRHGGIFERDRYVTPPSLLSQMRMAYDAVESDDIVSGIADTSEALAFNRVDFFAEDSDEQDIYNQISADIDLDSRLREMWRELFTCSQLYYAIWWGDKTYKVRGESQKGNARRKSYNLRVPLGITMLDPLRIVPVGSTLFNQERLAYVADRDEANMFDDPQIRLTDPIVSRLFVGRHPTDKLSADEKRWISSEGLNADNLFLLNPNVVFRHTLTRPQFRRLASVRMKSVFELLDLKHQLRSMDRAHLIGGANFIVLIKKGTDKIPAKQAEVSNLQEQVRTIAKLPVLVGDHRLSVEIITPKTDNTIDHDRYSALDSRITARLYGMFLLGGSRSAVGTNSDDSGGLAKVIARGLEARRYMLKRNLEGNIFNPIFKKNDSLLTAPKMRFHPNKIDLTFDPNFANFLLELRQSNELSRETLLSQFDINQDDEAQMLQRESQEYDKIFKTQVPFSTPNPRNGGDGGDGGGDVVPQPEDAPTPPAQKRRAGRVGGGNKNGGGSAPGTGQGQPPRNPRKKSD